MRSDSQHNEDAQVDPALDQLLRTLMQQPALSAEQHARIRARLGLPARSTSTSRTMLSGSAGRHAGAERRAASHPRLNAETGEPEEVHMLTRLQRTGRHDRSQWLELAAVLAVVLVAVVALAVFRGQSDSPPQHGGAPPLPTATATVSPTPTPEAVVTLPTPDIGGMYRNVTADQARALVPFALQLPAHLPDEFAAPVISVSETVQEGRAESTWAVTLMLALAADPATEPVEYVQTSADPVNPPAGRSTTIELAGETITRTVVEVPGGRPLLIYSWQSDGVFRSVSALTDDSLPVSLVDRLVSAIFGLQGDAIEEGESSQPVVNDDGLYVDLTPAEARRLVPLALLFAEPAPAGFAEPSISVEILEQRDSGETYIAVNASYAVSGAPESERAVEYIQTNQRPQNPPGGEMSRVELGGRTVNKAMIAGETAPALVVYTWADRGTFASLSARLDDELRVEHVESLVAAIVSSAPERHAVGETAVSDGIAITVSEVTYPTVLETAAPAGTKHIVVRGTYANDGITLVDISRHLDAMLFDEAGWRILPEVTSLETPATDLRPGQTATFELGFVVPDTGSGAPVTLTFSPNPATPLNVIFTIPAE
jgi:hypothetical protein